jgi:Tfp pilus assembly protein PilN
MNELQLDYQNIRPFPWGGVLLLLLALTIMVTTGIYYQNLNAQTALLETRADKIERAAKKQYPGGRSSEGMAKEVKRANEVLRQLSLPWGNLFQTIESAATKNVALLALEPDTEKRQVKISGEAKNIEAMIDYIKKMENHEVFGTVYLQSHHVQMQDPERPVRFVLQAIWKAKS